jgi:hypothetical protein
VWHTFTVLVNVWWACGYQIDVNSFKVNVKQIAGFADFRFGTSKPG